MEEPYIHKIFVDDGQEIETQTWLGKTGLADTETEDPEKAAYAYPIKHYTHWKHALEIETLEFGRLTENLSVLEMDEFTVCIGDIYKFGDALIQVSQPGTPHLPSVKSFKTDAQNSGRTGWYFRVLEEGHVISQIDVELVDRPYPQWTIAACNEIMYLYKDDLRLADELASCKLLSIHWRRALKRRLRGL